MLNRRAADNAKNSPRTQAKAPGEGSGKAPDAAPRTLERVGENRTRATWGMSIGLAAALFVMLLLRHHTIGQRFAYDSLDVWFNLRDGRTSNRVGIVAIDSETVRGWDGRLFDDRDLARTLRALKKAGVSSVAIALPFPAGIAGGGTDVQGQKEWLSALRETNFAYLPLLARSSSGRGVSAPVDAREMEKHSIPLVQAQSRGLAMGSPAASPVRALEAPPASWLRASSGVGHTAFGLDAVGRPRIAYEVLPWEGRLYPSLALLVAARERGFAWPRLLREDRAETLLLDFSALDLPQPPRSLPKAPVGEVSGAAPLQHLSKYLKRGLSTAENRTPSITVVPESEVHSGVGFATVPVHRIVRDPASAQVLAGKSVIVCVTAGGLSPTHFAPDGRRIHEGELHAVALDNLLSNSVLTEAPEIWLWLLTILPCVVVGGFVASRPPMWSAIVTLLSLLTIFILSAGLFAQDVWFDITPSWLGIGLTYLTGVIGRARRDTREATRTASAIDAISRASALIAAQGQTQELLDRVLAWVVQTMNAQAASILLLDEGREHLSYAASTGMGADERRTIRLRVGDGVAGWVARHGVPAVLPDARADSRFDAAMDQALGLSTQSMVCLPLRVRDETLGVLEVVNRRDGQPYESQDVELLSAIAAQAAIALENARLYELLNRRVERSEESLEETNSRLESEKNLLQTVLHSMTDGVVVIDEDERIQLFNRAASRLLPELTERQGDGLADVLEEYPDQFTRIAGDRRGGRSSLFKRGDVDAPRFIEARSAPLPFRANSQKRQGEIIVFADVTEEKHIEQAKSDFVSFVAHEMRSPLTTIAGFSSMLHKSEAREGQPNPQRLRFLGLIHDESERLKRLINSLLDIARIEAGYDIEMLIEEFDFAPVALRAIESQRTYSSRHAIVHNWPQDLPPVKADRDKLTQILINLLSNALKYSPGGTVTVSARVLEGAQVLEGQLETQDWLEVRVHDQGPGISYEQQNRLFERFGRLTNPVGAGERAKPSGTGLGLFLTKHLVELQQGQMRVESVENEGSAFIFTLPLGHQ
jgi:signal transduction histidine kinase/CHASE2 domain-containing sensor protein